MKTTILIQTIRLNWFSFLKGKREREREREEKEEEENVCQQIASSKDNSGILVMVNFCEAD